MDNKPLSFFSLLLKVVACLCVTGILIYESHACFFMTCLIAFSAIRHSTCQDHKNTHLHRTFRVRWNAGRAWESRWSEVFCLLDHADIKSFLQLSQLIDWCSHHFIFTRVLDWTGRKAGHIVRWWHSTRRSHSNCKREQSVNWIQDFYLICSLAVNKAVHRTFRKLSP